MSETELRRHHDRRDRRQGLAIAGTIGAILALIAVLLAA